MRMVFEEGDPLVDGDVLLFASEEEKQQTDIYAGIISAEGNECNHFSIVDPNKPLKSTFCPIKSNSSDDSTAAGMAR